MNNHQSTTLNLIPQSLVGRLKWDSSLVDLRAMGKLPLTVLASSVQDGGRVYTDVCVSRRWKLSHQDLMISVYELGYHRLNQTLFQYYFQVHPLLRGLNDGADRE